MKNARTFLLWVNYINLQSARYFWPDSILEQNSHVIFVLTYEKIYNIPH